jgi:hypothetical protein
LTCPVCGWTWDLRLANVRRIVRDDGQIALQCQCPKGGHIFKPALVEKPKETGA